MLVFGGGGRWWEQASHVLGGRGLSRWDLPQSKASSAGEGVGGGGVSTRQPLFPDDIILDLQGWLGRGGERKGTFGCPGLLPHHLSLLQVSQTPGG